MSRYYTGKGDDGNTGILSSKRLSKDDPIIEAIGTVDELNSYIGVAIFYIHDDLVSKKLRMIQNDLFVIGAELSDIEGRSGAASLKKGSVSMLEESVEAFASKIPELKKFVIPGGCEGSVHLQYARAIARKAERYVIKASKKTAISNTVKSYLNRLSSLLFVMAIYLNNTQGITEENPVY